MVLIHDYLASDDAADFADLGTNMRELASSASIEVKAAWGVLGDDYDRFTELMGDASSRSRSSCTGEDNGKLPASIDKKQFARFFRKLMALEHTAEESEVSLCSRKHSAQEYALVQPTRVSAAMTWGMPGPLLCQLS